MKFLLAWLSLVHNKARTLVAVAGITFSITLVFLELGLYGAVERAATMIHDRLDYDLLLVSPEYVYLARTGTLPRHRLRQAAAVTGVASVTPLYVGGKYWRNPLTRRHHRLLVMAFNPRGHAFNLPEVEDARRELEKPDVVLIDRLTRPEFGSQETGTVTEIDQRRVQIAGQYTLGTGFGFYGAVILSDQNFARLFEGYSLDNVSLGLVRVRQDADADAVAAALRGMLPADVRVLTRPELQAQEQRYWTQQTPTGLMFGFGAVLAAVVGLVILYQVLATDITKQLPEYAMLKALGYRDAFLRGVVLVKVHVLALVAYLPALGLALVLYAAIRDAARLPITMNAERAGGMLLLTVLMGSAAGLSCLRKLRTADPADLF
jgi:putative ABC transport system permease protein